jgi:acetoin utilization deacetylase AcuC-like enzyme
LKLDLFSPVHMQTGIFFYYQQGERLKDFPDALGRILSRPNVFFYDAFYPLKPGSSFDLEPISPASLYKVHAPQMVQRVMATGEYEGALYSAAGTVSAAIKVGAGEITNAFVFTGYGDHHAGRDFFGGGCYFNGAAIAIQEVKERFNLKKFAVVDSDAHHGDGSWALFENDPDVLYVCFCSKPDEIRNCNINIQVPPAGDDDTYLSLFRDVLRQQIRIFHPEILFWNWGYDGTTGEYGDMGLTAEVHTRLALELKRLAGEVCNGRLIVVLCGGSRRDLASMIIPGVVEVLANESS